MLNHIILEPFCESSVTRFEVGELENPGHRPKQPRPNPTDGWSKVKCRTPRSVMIGKYPAACRIEHTSPLGGSPALSSPDVARDSAEFRQNALTWARAAASRDGVQCRGASGRTFHDGARGNSGVGVLLLVQQLTSRGYPHRALQAQTRHARLGSFPLQEPPCLLQQSDQQTGKFGRRCAVFDADVDMWHRCLSLPSLSSVNAIDCCLLLSLLLQDSLGDTLIWVFEMIAATLISSLSLLAVAKGAALAPQAACAVTFDGRIKAEATVADFDGGSTGFRSGYVLGQSKQQCNNSHITKANSLRSKVG